MTPETISFKKQILSRFRYMMKLARRNYKKSDFYSDKLNNPHPGTSVYEVKWLERNERIHACCYFRQKGEADAYKKMWKLIKAQEKMQPVEMQSPGDNDFSHIPESDLPFKK